MTMKLTRDDLVVIAGKVQELEGLGIDAKVIEVKGHDVYLKREEGSLFIVGITDKVLMSDKVQKQAEGGAMRGSDALSGRGLRR